MRIKITLRELLHGLRSDIIAIHILLLIDRLQFVLEQAEDRIAQPFAVQFSPMGHVLRCEYIIIGSTVVRSLGIEFRSSITGDEPVEFIRNDVLSRLLVEVVDLLHELFAFGRILRLGQFVVFEGNLIQEAFLSRIVQRADPVRALEHHVFEIVGNACIGRVLGSCLYHDGTKNLRLTVIFIQPHCQTIA